MQKQVLVLLLAGLLIVTQAIAQQDLPAQHPQAEQDQEKDKDNDVVPNHATQIGPCRALVPSYTGLKFALVTPLDSKTAKPGDEVQLRLVRALVVHADTLLAEGTIVHRRVNKVTPAQSKCRQARLDWDVSGITFPDGSVAKTRMITVNADPASEVPHQLPTSRPDDRPGWAFWVFGSPLIVVAGAALVALGGPYLLATGIDDHFARPPKVPCTAMGQDVVLPVGSIVGVVVTKNHKVRY